jgi:hypothetical protein
MSWTPLLAGQVRRNEGKTRVRRHPAETLAMRFGNVEQRRPFGTISGDCLFRTPVEASALGRAYYVRIAAAPWPSSNWLHGSKLEI